MTFFNKSALAIALLTAVGVASAANVSIYGRIDTGIAYQNHFGDSTKSDSLTMETGTNTASRVGIQGSEQINDDLSVGFRMESRFASDTGELKGDRLFEGSAFLKLFSKQMGELAAGRIAGMGSGSGPYDLQIFMDSFGGGTFGTALAPVKSTRMDNVLVYRTPMMAGFQATFQHSLKKETTDKGDESEGAVDRFWAAGFRYNVGQLNLVGVYEGVTWGHLNANAPDNDRKVFTLGGSYRFEPVTVYAQAQYFDGVEKLDGFASSGSNAMTGLKGYGIYLGTQTWHGLSSWQSMIYYRDYESSERATGRDFDADSIGVATKYLYRPTKTVEMYVGGGVSKWDRLSDGKVLTDKSFNVFTGVTKYF